MEQSGKKKEGALPAGVVLPKGLTVTEQPQSGTGRGVVVPSGYGQIFVPVQGNIGFGNHDNSAPRPGIPVISLPPEQLSLTQADGQFSLTSGASHGNGAKTSGQSQGQALIPAFIMVPKAKRPSIDGSVIQIDDDNDDGSKSSNKEQKQDTDSKTSSNKEVYILPKTVLQMTEEQKNSYLENLNQEELQKSKYKLGQPTVTQSSAQPGISNKNTSERTVKGDCSICGEKAVTITHGVKVCEECIEFFEPDDESNAKKNSSSTDKKSYCKVCEKRVSTNVRYGVNTCESCKSFFSKCVETDTKISRHEGSLIRSENCGCDLCVLKKCYYRGLVPIYPNHHICMKCDKPFYLNHFLRQHELTCHTYARFNCTKCQKRFKTKSHLNQHMMEESNCRTYREKHTFSCDICWKSYEKLSVLIQHRFIHKDDEILAMENSLPQISWTNSANKECEAVLKAENCGPDGANKDQVIVLDSPEEQASTLTELENRLPTSSTLLSPSSTTNQSTVVKPISTETSPHLESTSSQPEKRTSTSSTLNQSQSVVPVCSTASTQNSTQVVEDSGLSGDQAIPEDQENSESSVPEDTPSQSSEVPTQSVESKVNDNSNSDREQPSSVSRQDSEGFSFIMECSDETEPYTVSLMSQPIAKKFTPSERPKIVYYDSLVSKNLQTSQQQVHVDATSENLPSTPEELSPIPDNSSPVSDNQVTSEPVSLLETKNTTLEVDSSSSVTINPSPDEKSVDETGKVHTVIQSSIPMSGHVTIIDKRSKSISGNTMLLSVPLGVMNSESCASTDESEQPNKKTTLKVPPMSSSSLNSETPLPADKSSQPKEMMKVNDDNLNILSQSSPNQTAEENYVVSLHTDSAAESSENQIQENELIMSPHTDFTADTGEKIDMGTNYSSDHMKQDENSKTQKATSDKQELVPSIFTEKVQISSDIISHQELPINLVSDQMKGSKALISEGQVLSETVTENQVLSETVTENQDLSKSVTENQVLSETVTENQDLSETVTENQDLSETVTQNRDLSETVTENQVFSKTVTENQVLSENVTENQDLSETVTENQDLSKTVTENRDLSETVTENQVLSKIVTENQVLSETVTENQNLSETVTENQDLSETVTENQVLSESVTENQDLSEAVTENQVLSKTVTENQVLAETVTENQDLSDNLTENQVLSDNSTENQVSSKNVQINEHQHNQMTNNDISSKSEYLSRKITETSDFEKDDTDLGNLITSMLAQGVCENETDKHSEEISDISSGVGTSLRSLDKSAVLSDQESDFRLFEVANNYHDTKKAAEDDVHNNAKEGVHMKDFIGDIIEKILTPVSQSLDICDLTQDDETSDFETENLQCDDSEKGTGVQNGKIEQTEVISSDVIEFQPCANGNSNNDEMKYSVPDVELKNSDSPKTVDDIDPQSYFVDDDDDDNDDLIEISFEGDSEESETKMSDSSLSNEEIRQSDLKDNKNGKGDNEQEESFFANCNLSANEDETEQGLPDVAGCNFPSMYSERSTENNFNTMVSDDLNRNSEIENVETNKDLGTFEVEEIAPKTNLKVSSSSRSEVYTKLKKLSVCVCPSTDSTINDAFCPDDSNKTDTESSNQLKLKKLSICLGPKIDASPVTQTTSSADKIIKNADWMLTSSKSVEQCDATGEEVPHVIQVDSSSENQESSVAIYLPVHSPNSPQITGISSGILVSDDDVICLSSDDEVETDTSTRPSTSTELIKTQKETNIDKTVPATSPDDKDKNSKISLRNQGGRQYQTEEKVKSTTKQSVQSSNTNQKKGISNEERQVTETRSLQKTKSKSTQQQAKAKSSQQEAEAKSTQQAVTKSTQQASTTRSAQQQANTKSSQEQTENAIAKSTEQEVPSSSVSPQKSQTSQEEENPSFMSLKESISSGRVLEALASLAQGDEAEVSSSVGIAIPPEYMIDLTDTEQCYFCFNPFTKTEFHDHMRVTHSYYSSGMDNSCCHCGEVFDSLLEVSRHEFSVHGLTLSCPMCGWLLKDNESLIMHVVNHLSPTTYLCLKCRQDFESVTDVEDHIVAEHDDGVVWSDYLKCCFCDCLFVKRNKYYSHIMNLHQHVFKFKCRACTQGFVSLNALNIHRSNVDCVLDGKQITFYDTISIDSKSLKVSMAKGKFSTEKTKKDAYHSRGRCPKNRSDENSDEVNDEHVVSSTVDHTDSGDDDNYPMPVLSPVLPEAPSMLSTSQQRKTRSGKQTSKSNREDEQVNKSSTSKKSEEVGDKSLPTLKRPKRLQKCSKADEDGNRMPTESSQKHKGAPSKNQTSTKKPKLDKQIDNSNKKRKAKTDGESPGKKLRSTTEVSVGRLSKDRLVKRSKAVLASKVSPKKFTDSSKKDNTSKSVVSPRKQCVNKSSPIKSNNAVKNKHENSKKTTSEPVKNLVKQSDKSSNSKTSSESRINVLRSPDMKRFMEKPKPKSKKLESLCKKFTDASKAEAKSKMNKKSPPKSSEKKITHKISKQVSTESSTSSTDAYSADEDEEEGKKEEEEEMVTKSQSTGFHISNTVLQQLTNNIKICLKKCDNKVKDGRMILSSEKQPGIPNIISKETSDRECVSLSEPPMKKENDFVMETDEIGAEDKVMTRQFGGEAKTVQDGGSSQTAEEFLGMLLDCTEEDCDIDPYKNFSLTDQIVDGLVQSIKEKTKSQDTEMGVKKEECEDPDVVVLSSRKRPVHCILRVEKDQGKKEMLPIDVHEDKSTPPHKRIRLVEMYAKGESFHPEGSPQIETTPVVKQEQDTKETDSPAAFTSIKSKDNISAETEMKNLYKPQEKNKDASSPMMTRTRSFPKNTDVLPIQKTSSDKNHGEEASNSAAKSTKFNPEQNKDNNVCTKNSNLQGSLLVDSNVTIKEEVPTPEMDVQGRSTINSIKKEPQSPPRSITNEKSDASSRKASSAPNKSEDVKRTNATSRIGAESDDGVLSELLHICDRSDSNQTNSAENLKLKKIKCEKPDQENSDGRQNLDSDDEKDTLSNSGQKSRNQDNLKSEKQLQSKTTFFDKYREKVEIRTSPSPQVVSNLRENLQTLTNTATVSSSSSAGISSQQSSTSLNKTDTTSKSLGNQIIESVVERMGRYLPSQETTSDNSKKLLDFHPILLNEITQWRTNVNYSKTLNNITILAEINKFLHKNFPVGQPLSATKLQIHPVLLNHIMTQPWVLGVSNPQSKVLWDPISLDKVNSLLHSKYPVTSKIRSSKPSSTATSEQSSSTVSQTDRPSCDLDISKSSSSSSLTSQMYSQPKVSVTDNIFNSQTIPVCGKLTPEGSGGSLYTNSQSVTTGNNCSSSENASHTVKAKIFHPPIFMDTKWCTRSPVDLNIPKRRNVDSKKDSMVDLSKTFISLKNLSKTINPSIHLGPKLSTQSKTTSVGENSNSVAASKTFSLKPISSLQEGNSKSFTSFEYISTRKNRTWPDFPQLGGNSSHTNTTQTRPPYRDFASMAKESILSQRSAPGSYSMAYTRNTALVPSPTKNSYRQFMIRPTSTYIPIRHHGGVARTALQRKIHGRYQQSHTTSSGMLQTRSLRDTRLQPIVSNTLSTSQPNAALLPREGMTPHDTVIDQNLHQRQTFGPSVAVQSQQNTALLQPVAASTHMRADKVGASSMTTSQSDFTGPTLDLSVASQKLSMLAQFMSKKKTGSSAAKKASVMGSNITRPNETIPSPQAEVFSQSSTLPGSDISFSAHQGTMSQTPTLSRSDLSQGAMPVSFLERSHAAGSSLDLNASVHPTDVSLLRKNYNT